MELIHRTSEQGRWADLCSEASEDDPPENLVLKTQICSFWKKGKCKRGINCTFAHGNDELNQPVVLQVIACPFYRAGYCRLGDKCRNLHDDAGAEEAIPQVCKFWQQNGKCKKGSDCEFSHGDLQRNQSAVRRASLCQFQSLGVCKFGDRCLQAHTERELVQDVNGDSDSKPTSRARAHTDFIERQTIADATLRRRGNSEQTLGTSRPATKVVTKKQICMYWEKGKCTRGSGCLFAHGAEELNQSASDQFFKTSLCKYFKAGRCTLGSKCRQAHSREELTHFTNERQALFFEDMVGSLLESDEGKEVAEVADDKESTLDGDQKSLSDAVDSEGTSSSPDTDILRSPLQFPDQWPEVTLDNDDLPFDKPKLEPTVFYDEYLANLADDSEAWPSAWGANSEEVALTLQRAAPDHYED